MKNNPAAVGNAALDPETIQTWELAFDYQPVHRFRTLLNLFYYEADDLIDFYTDQVTGISTAQNLKNQEGYGFELEGDWQMTDTLQLRGNFSYQHSEDMDTGELVPDAPQLQFYANALWEFRPDWSFNVDLFWIADRNRAEGDIRSKIDDYTKVDFILRRKNIAAHWDVALAVRNLFDEDIREPSDGKIPDDYPMEGRSIYGEIRFQF
jgi:iron complex outermembrane receptor protein